MPVEEDRVGHREVHHLAGEDRRHGGGDGVPGRLAALRPGAGD